MANHASAKKRIRQTIAKTEVNRQRKSKIRTAIKQVVSAILEKNKEASLDGFKKAESIIMSGVSNGIFKQKTASRKVSRLSKLIKRTFSSSKDKVATSKTA